MTITQITKTPLQNVTDEEQEIWSAIHHLAVYLELRSKNKSRVMLARALAHLDRSGLMPPVELHGRIIKITNEKETQDGSTENN